MWRCRLLGIRFPLLLVVVLPWYGCAARGPEIVDVSEEWRAYSPEQPGGAQAAASTAPASAAERRVRELEQQLAQQDRQIAAVQSDIQTTRGGAPAPHGVPQAAHSAQTTTPPLQQAAPAAPPSAPSTAGAAVTPSDSGSRTAGSAPEVDVSTEAAAPPAGTAVIAAVAGGAVPADARLAEAQRRIGRLERQLELEVKRRKDVEGEMARLLQETAAGPYEQAPNVVEKHLREELTRARKEIGQLRSTLLSERRERDNLERRFATLQAQVQNASKPAPASGVSNEEVEALKERQRRVLASIQQDLAASKQREAELLQSLQQSQGNDGVTLAEDVSSLRSENSALQIRLDDEHRRNQELTAKLQLATRVTDLIYKMQSNGTESVAAVPLPAEE